MRVGLTCGDKGDRGGLMMNFQMNEFLQKGEGPASPAPTLNPPLRVVVNVLKHGKSFYSIT